MNQQQIATSTPLAGRLPAVSLTLPRCRMAGDFFACVHGVQSIFFAA